ncbi:MAG TPA: hypothetical protein VLC48_06990, partial [Gemmatimonadota bacterium]|nr:hypothetical protein [Gemmatimonadota bacterium]
MWSEPAESGLQQGSPQDTARSRAAVPQDTARRASSADSSAAAAEIQDSLRPAPQDTVRRIAGADSSAAAAESQDTVPPASPQDTTPPRSDVLRLGLKTVALPVPLDLTSRIADPGRSRFEFRSQVREWNVVWAELVQQRAAELSAALWIESRPIAAGLTVPEPDEEPDLTDLAEFQAVFDTLGAPEPEVPPDFAGPGQPQAGAELLPDVFGQYADLGVAIQGRVEMGGGWSRYRPCVASVQNCAPSIIPNLKPDIQFGARVGGTITDRIHVAVDYDNRREFDAANNINVYYQGLEDEILQRIEVGDVSFPLPQSRYLTQGIPAGNFGIRANGQMGPIDFQAVWAQQKGDLGTRELQVGGSGQGFEQTSVTVLDDADYEKGRFFFLFSPTRLASYPDVNVQQLVATDAPDDLRPVSSVKVYRYEPINFGVGGQIAEGFITAVAVAVDTIQTAAGLDTVVTDTLSGLFRPLNEGEDYILHRSGTWLILRNTLTEAEGLAITYIAASGDTIGTFNAEQQSEAHNADPGNVPPP